MSHDFVLGLGKEKQKGNVYFIKDVGFNYYYFRLNASFSLFIAWVKIKAKQNYKLDQTLLKKNYKPDFFLEETTN